MLHRQKGMTLIEVLISAAVFLFIALSVYATYSKTLELVRISRVKITATNLANEQFEIARNLPYASVGLINGVPAGVLSRTQTLVRDGVTFQATTSIQNMDDPFDGVAGGVPNDTSPADYKEMEIIIGCSTCVNFQPMTFTGRINPKDVEAASTNGSLFIRAFDANGTPVSNANVLITNTAAGISISDVTDTNGLYDLIDTPPAANGYHVVVSKAGYSTDQTYPLNGVGLSNPANPDSTVLVQQVTQNSFFIDKTSTINVNSVKSNCAPVGNINFNLTGAKVKGTNSGSTVYKYNNNFVTDSGGLKTLSSLEWDTYNVNFLDTAYDLAGTISPLPVNLAPNSTQNVTLVVQAKDPNALLVTVKDAATGLPLTDATVNLTDNDEYNQSFITDRGFLKQTDWSGGDSQTNFANDETKFLSSDGNVEYIATPGVVSLKSILGIYQSSGVLTSSTFDTGSASNFHQLLWNPGSQPQGVGLNSVRFQIATNNDNATWVYKGPDGTSGTYYSASNQNISTSHNGDRYLRYKMFLATDDTSKTPTISDVSFTFTSACVPPGQVLFTNLSSGNYSYTITRTGYQTFTGTLTISSTRQNLDVPLQVN
jgi:prepilin-type N-terminal cleavage/methylation domain-containing protein